MGNASSATPPAKPSTETSSSCTTQGITGAHNFDVNNFSLLEGMGAGELVRSSTFSVGGCDWRINLYPDGFTAAQKDHVSAYLAPQSTGHEGVRARFTLTVVGKDGKGKAEWQDTDDSEYTFKSPFRGRGWHEFIHKSSRFRRWLRNNNDGFTVRCVVTVIQDPRVAVVVPEPSVLRDLASMLRDGDGADVTFVVGGQSFPAHRCVLAARSAVFRAELFGNMKEKSASLVWVDDMELSVFVALLNFVYTDSLPDDDDNKEGRNNVAMQQHLLVAADRYGLDRLKVICEDRLCRGIDVETVATSLTLAEQHHCVRLKGDCLRFIALSSRDVVRSVMKTDGFKHLVASCPLLVQDIYGRSSSSLVGKSSPLAESS